MHDIDSLVDLPGACVLSEDHDFPEDYPAVTRGQVVCANLVPDERVAALLRQHPVKTLYTANAGTDFRRFPFLDTRNPLAPS